jgi:hypothetical protein
LPFSFSLLPAATFLLRFFKLRRIFTASIRLVPILSASCPTFGFWPWSHTPSAQVLLPPPLLPFELRQINSLLFACCQLPSSFAFSSYGGQAAFTAFTGI